jgi:hypothetical protein
VTGISGITTGPDGNVWFASRNGWIGQIQAAPADTTPPTITTPGEVTGNATSPSGATVTYEVTASDNTDANPTVVCDPRSGSTFAIGDTLVRCAATDPAGNIASASFTVHVNGALEQLVALRHSVFDVGPGSSLADKLTLAITYVNDHRLGDACSTLDSFIAQVKSQTGKSIPVATASQLIADASRIKTVLDC